MDYPNIAPIPAPAVSASFRQPRSSLSSPSPFSPWPQALPAAARASWAARPWPCGGRGFILSHKDCEANTDEIGICVNGFLRRPGPARPLHSGRAGPPVAPRARTPAREGAAGIQIGSADEGCLRLAGLRPRALESVPNQSNPISATACCQISPVSCEPLSIPRQ